MSKNELTLVKSMNFGSVRCDFWKNNDGNIFMSSEQLGQALGYAVPRESINKLVSRNDYLRSIEFSAEVKMTSPSGIQITRIFTEDGIYEVTFLASTPKAKEFRAWVRQILKGLRTGKLKLKPATTADEAKLIRARAYAARPIFEAVKQLKGTLPTENLVMLINNAIAITNGQQVQSSNNVERNAFEQGVKYIMVMLKRLEGPSNAGVDEELLKYMMEDMDEFLKEGKVTRPVYDIFQYTFSNYNRLKDQLN